MTQGKYTDIIISLAGMAQAIRLTQQLAWKGEVSQADFQTVLNSIVKLDAESVAEIYGSSYELNSGLRTLAAQIDPERGDRDPEFAKYMANIMTIERQFQSNPELVAVMKSRLTHVNRQLTMDAIDSPAVISALADTYSQTLSKLPLRIQVKGDPNYLQQPSIQDQVRACLLGAVRSCVLWRQVGGKRRQFILNRRSLLAALDDLLHHPMS